MPRRLGRIARGIWTAVAATALTASVIDAANQRRHWAADARRQAVNRAVADAQPRPVVWSPNCVGAWVGM